MLRKIIITTLFVIAVISTPQISYAADYGQEVLGEESSKEEITHEPVKAGLNDHPQYLGFAFLAGSFISFAISKKAKKASLEI